jgi:hypothetical protein
MTRSSRRPRLTCWLLDRARARAVVVVVVAAEVVVLACAAIGCGSSDANDPECFDGTPVAPPLSDHMSDALGAAKRDLPAGSFTVDLEACDHAQWSGWLPLGSAWVLVHPDGLACELWLGGETESPKYDGSPTQYCRLRRAGCKATLTIGNGGPARLVSQGCVEL